MARTDREPARKRDHVLLWTADKVTVSRGPARRRQLAVARLPRAFYHPFVRKGSEPEGGTTSRTRHQRSHNLAARMGRWSADHWKTATFGWLAFVLVAFGLGGMAGTKTIDPNTAGPGESGRMDRILDAGFKRPADESVLVQSRSLSATDPAFTAAVEDVVARLSKLDGRPERPLAARRGQRGPDLRERPRGARRVRDPRRSRRGRRQDRPGPRPGRRRAERPPELFIGEFGDASACQGGRGRRSRTTWARPGSCRSRSRSSSS